jgi:hypothetical protein
MRTRGKTDHALLGQEGGRLTRPNLVILAFQETFLLGDGFEHRAVNGDERRTLFHALVLGKKRGYLLGEKSAIDFIESGIHNHGHIGQAVQRPHESVDFLVPGRGRQNCQFAHILNLDGFPRLQGHRVRQVADQQSCAVVGLGRSRRLSKQPLQIRQQRLNLR